MERTERRFFHFRLRVLLFITIVWTVAGSFVVIEIAALGGMDFLMAKPEWTGEFVLFQATRDSKTCSVNINSPPWYRAPGCYLSRFDGVLTPHAQLVAQVFAA
jgi:hypothetical protein